MEESILASKNAEVIQNSLLTIALEGWRFAKVFERAIMKLDYEDQNRFAPQLRWFRKKIEEAMEEAGLKIVNVEGYPFDPGMAATPLNIGDFDAEDSLFIDQMIEPIIMDKNGIVRTGTITLRKVEQ